MAGSHVRDEDSAKSEEGLQTFSFESGQAIRLSDSLKESTLAIPFKMATSSKFIGQIIIIDSDGEVSMRRDEGSLEYGMKYQQQQFNEGSHPELQIFHRWDTGRAVSSHLPALGTVLLDSGLILYDDLVDYNEEQEIGEGELCEVGGESKGKEMHRKGENQAVVHVGRKGSSKKVVGLVSLAVGSSPSAFASESLGRLFGKDANNEGVKETNNANLRVVNKKVGVNDGKSGTGGEGF
ncbi:hypothetical protein NDU88_004952 [Pleurodeles waltl]|uniref:Uncharacterized protein n=1 Tax=Pleurodeles waltl TaxID=8319 RepID=A0AAV7VLU2_PLEWA|nr:hypothetical protein NDU88_004952 [Pleurodeles waltl]